MEENFGLKLGFGRRSCLNFGSLECLEPMIVVIVHEENTMVNCAFT